eukprot:jgi/Psemu1/53821/gm1.53821_g
MVASPPDEMETAGTSCQNFAGIATILQPDDSVEARRGESLQKEAEKRTALRPRNDLVEAFIHNAIAAVLPHEVWRIGAGGYLVGCRLCTKSSNEEAQENF